MFDSRLEAAVLFVQCKVSLRCGKIGFTSTHDVFSGQMRLAIVVIVTITALIIVVLSITSRTGNTTTIVREMVHIPIAAMPTDDSTTTTSAATTTTIATPSNADTIDQSGNNIKIPVALGYLGSDYSDVLCGRDLGYYSM